MIIILNIPNKIICSGGYSNLGALVKDFQKFMSLKKRTLILAFTFSPKLMVFSKKKKVFTSVSSLISLFSSQNQGVL